MRGAFDATLLDRTSMSASSSKTTPDTPVDVHTGSRVVALCTWSVSSANSRATAAGHLSQNRAAPCVKNASSLTPPGRAALMPMPPWRVLPSRNAPAANARVTRRMQPTFRIEKPPFCVGAQATP